MLRYLILQPLLRILTKSPYYAVQSILHVLFLPTPFKRAPIAYSQNPERTDITDSEGPVEVLKPGAFYSNCAVVPLNIPNDPKLMKSKPTDQQGKEKDGNKDEIILEDDGEMGGEALGRSVWESYEVQLKTWEDSENEQADESTETSNLGAAKPNTSTAVKPKDD